MAIRNVRGSWVVYWNEGGKRKEKYFGSGPVNRTRAEQYNEKMGFGKQNRQDPSAVIFVQFLEPYLKYLQAHATNEINYKNVIWKCTGSILPFFGTKDIYALIHADLDDYILHRKAQVTKKGTPPKNGTINREIDEIQSYLNWCVTNRKILSNPLAGYKRPGDDREVIAPPSIAEINLIIQNAAPHIKRFVFLCFYLGARPGPIEIGALEWKHVNWDEGKILIRSADKKGLNARRIDINEGFLPLLRAWYIEDHNNEHHGTIVHYKHKPVASIKNGFASAKKRAGITRRLRPYDLRHANITTKLEAGADMKAVSKDAGHKSPDTTMKVYQHLSGHLQKQATEMLPQLDMPETGIRGVK